MKVPKFILFVFLIFMLLFSTIGQVSGKPIDSEYYQISEIPPYNVYLPLVMNGKGPIQSAPYPAGNPSPADGVRGQILDPSLMWTGSDPDGDALVYDVYLDAHNPTPTTKVANHQSASSYVPSSLKGNTTYFWKVVSFDTHGASTVSPVWRFTTLNLPPDPAANPSPTDGAIDQSLTLTLSWTGSDPDSDYLRYNVYLDASNPNPTTKVANFQSATTFSPSMLTTNTVYYWKVLSVDSDSAFTSSPVWRFTTLNLLPDPATNPSPTDGARGVILNPSLMWTGSDPDGDALVYDVYFDRNNPPTTNVANHQSASSFVTSLLKGNTYYFWKVVSFDTHGASSTSPVWHFNTLNLPPDPAANPSPANMAVDQSVYPQLSWTGSDPDSDYLRYIVYLDASNPNPTTKVANFQSATTFSPSMLTANTVYYWKVLSVDRDGAFTSSPVWHFFTISVNMVLVPAGEFQMGCDPGHNADFGCNSAELPLHPVYLDAYFIDTYEVTTAHYAQCVSTGFCTLPSDVSSSTQTSYYGNENFNNYPLIYVGWNDANDYCKWAGKRLPTEAEWEKAARGTTPRTYPWGDTEPTCGLANFKNISNCVGDTTGVDSYAIGASPYGALNMAGNVWEWVSDWYGVDYYSNVTAPNPTGPDTGDYKVLRGGGWIAPRYDLRTAFRDYAEPDDYRNYFGFRCVSPAP